MPYQGPRVRPRRDVRDAVGRQVAAWVADGMLDGDEHAGERAALEAIAEAVDVAVAQSRAGASARVPALAGRTLLDALRLVGATGQADALDELVASLLVDERDRSRDG